MAFLSPFRGFPQLNSKPTFLTLSSSLHPPSSPAAFWAVVQILPVAIKSPLWFWWLGLRAGGGNSTSGQFGHRRTRLTLSSITILQIQMGEINFWYRIDFLFSYDLNLQFGHEVFENMKVEIILKIDLQKMLEVLWLNSLGGRDCELTIDIWWRKIKLLIVAHGWLNGVLACCFRKISSKDWVNISNQSTLVLMDPILYTIGLKATFENLNFNLLSVLVAKEVHTYWKIAKVS